MLALAVLTSPTSGAAQDLNDIAAWAALTFTPTGGLVPLAPPIAGQGSAFVLRYGNIDLGLDNTLHNVSLGGDFALKNGRLGLTLGATKPTCDGCHDSIFAGMDYTAMLVQTKTLVGVRPSIGFSKPTEGDGSALSLAVSLPMGVELSGTQGPIFVPYLSPGIGYGRVSDDEESESGTRPMLGGGLSISGRQSGFAVHVGFQKTFIEDGETLFGLGLSFGRRRSP
jgi:hypothetical protein